MSKTLLYILDYYLPHKGGVETVFEQIITRSLAQGYKVIVLTSHYDPQLPKEEKIGNVILIRVGRGRKSFVRSAFRKGIQLFKKFPQISHIHTSTYGGAIPSSLLGYFFHRPVLLTVHEIFGKLWNTYKSRKSAWLFRFFEWIIFHLPFNAYHCVSSYTFNSLRLVYGISDKKLFLAYNGVDYDFRDSKKITASEHTQIKKKFGLTDKRNLLYFGHTGISKGIDTLVDSIPELLAQDKDLQLIFNFIPAQRDHFIKEKIQIILSALPASQKGRVKVWSGLPKKELRALVANVQGVIAPSLSEGFGSVHTETLALGTPLLTTFVSALPEVVGGKVLFFSPQNSSELVNAVSQLKKGIFNSLPQKTFSRDEQYQRILSWYKHPSS